MTVYVNGVGGRDIASASTSTITVGAENGSSIINVAMQLKSASGANLAVGTGITAWLSSTNAAPWTRLGSAPSGGVVAGTNGKIISSLVTNLAWLLSTNATGAVDVNITEAGTPTMYLVLLFSDGRVQVSSAITFAA